MYAAWKLLLDIVAFFPGKLLCRYASEAATLLNWEVPSERKKP